VLELREPRPAAVVRPPVPPRRRPRPSELAKRELLKREMAKSELALSVPAGVAGPPAHPFLGAVRLSCGSKPFPKQKCAPRGPTGSEVYFCASFLAQTKKER
jgi:hypothetical protein